MRILQVLPDGSAGGGTTVVLSLLRSLQSETDWDLHLLTELGSYAATTAKELGVSVHEQRLMHSRTDPKITQCYESLVEALKPDLIHLHGGRAAFLARRRRDKRVAYTIHGYHFARRSLVRRTLGMLAERVAAKAATQIVFVCEYDRNVGHRFGVVPAGIPSRVIYNGTSFKNLPSARSVPKTIAFIGRMVEPKDPLMAVKVMTLLAPKGFRMTMAGAGDLEEPVKSAIRQAHLAEAIQMLGEVSRERALEIIAQSEVLLMTSLWEGLPMAPLEAMAIGTPVVAPNVAGIPEIIRTGTNGDLAENHEPTCYASLIEQIHDNPVQTAKIIQAARETVSTKFSWQTCFQGYKALYEEMLA